jgi:hypothetical protein
MLGFALAVKMYIENYRISGILDGIQNARRTGKSKPTSWDFTLYNRCQDFLTYFSSNSNLRSRYLTSDVAHLQT